MTLHWSIRYCLFTGLITVLLHPYYRDERGIDSDIGNTTSGIALEWYLWDGEGNGESLPLSLLAVQKGDWSTGVSFWVPRRYTLWYMRAASRQWNIDAFWCVMSIENYGLKQLENWFGTCTELQTQIRLWRPPEQRTARDLRDLIVWMSQPLPPESVISSSTQRKSNLQTLKQTYYLQIFGLFVIVSQLDLVVVPPLQMQWPLLLCVLCCSSWVAVGNYGCLTTCAVVNLCYTGL